jgi:GxxExxY protein
LNQLSEQIIGCAIEVHHLLGPGMLESAYEACLCFELIHHGLQIERQVSMPIVYKGRRLDCGYRIDIVVEEAVIVEVKATDRVLPVHRAQLLSYLRMRRLSLGLLLNFNVKWFVAGGIHRIVNGFVE